jgi:hypothetical protein
MTLPLGKGKAAFRHFALKLTDALGYEVLADVKYGRVEQVEELPADEAGATETLAPGGSVKATLPVLIRLAEYVQDPQTVRTAHLYYSPSCEKDAWWGDQQARCDVRIACRYREWADELRKPDDQWAIDLSAGPWHEVSTATVATAADAWLSVALYRPRPDGGDTKRGNWSGKSLSNITLNPDEEKILASCFRVEREGKAVAGPEVKLDRVGLWLELLAARNESLLIQNFNLARYFDLSQPGAYRVRLVLPGAKGTSASGLLVIRIPAASE